MLIGFRVSNHRSFRDQQDLSLVAVHRDRELAESNLVDPGLKGSKGVQLLRSLALFGANASGKTNLIRALDFMRSMVLGSAQHLEQVRLLNRPFALERAFRQAPSSFEITFSHLGIRYDYGFVLTSARVESEWLRAYPNGLPRLFFMRDAAKEQPFTFGPLFKGDKRRLVPLTRPNALFLSVGAQFNHPGLGLAFEWFREHLICLTGTEDRRGLLMGHTLARSESEPAFKRWVGKLLHSSDTGIGDWTVERAQMPQLELEDPMTRQKIRIGGEGQEGYTFALLHEGLEGKLPMPFEDESMGTQMLLALAAPLYEAVEKGAVLAIDELDQSLHPMLVKAILDLIHNPIANRKGAQLIFTTHQPLFLDQTLIRRDQVWFAEKDATGATSLFPLTDFKARKGRYESILKGYLSGRYGAVPILRDLLS